jgi:hypothetical protein
VIAGRAIGPVHPGVFGSAGPGAAAGRRARLAARTTAVAARRAGHTAAAARPPVTAAARPPATIAAAAGAGDTAGARRACAAAAAARAAGWTAAASIRCQYDDDGEEARKRSGRASHDGTRGQLTHSIPSLLPPGNGESTTLSPRRTNPLRRTDAQRS